MLLLLFCVLPSTSSYGSLPPKDIVVSEASHERENLLYWSDPFTWKQLGTHIPKDGDVVTIPRGVKIVLDQNTPHLKGLRIDGEVHLAEKELSITADYILVKGLFQIGTESQPFNEQVTITLTTAFSDKEDSVESCGIKVICTKEGGILNLHGAYSSPTWTRLEDGSTAQIGDTSIRIEEPVEWQIGDDIVIVSTDFDPNQAEKRTITSVSEDKRTIYFDEPLVYIHWGEIMDYYGHKVDQRAEIMHLNRSILIQGDASSGEDNFGGHVIIHSKHFKGMHDMAHHDKGMHERASHENIMAEADWLKNWNTPEYTSLPEEMSKISGVEFTRMGQTGLMGRYPVHFHLVGNAKGAYVKNSSVHDSYQRCYTLHGTFGMLLENNVAYNSIGHCYFLESFIEKDNTLLNNIGAVMHYFPDRRLELIDSDSNPSIFWISFPTNNLIGNVAAGTNGIGIWIDLQDTGGSAHNEYANEPMGEIRDNVVHSSAFGSRKHLDETGDPETQGGIGFMYEGGVGPIHNLTAYKNVFNFWADESSDFELTESTFSDAHSSIWQRRDGSFNSVFVAHTRNTGTPRSDAEIEAGRSLPQFGKSHVNLISAIMGFYSKSFSINNTFIGYKSDDIFERGVASVGGRSFDAPIFFEGSTMIDSDPFVPSPGSTRAKRRRPSRNSVVIIDFDGRLTGTGTFKEIRTGPKILTDKGAGCAYHDTKFDQPIYLCDSRSIRFTSIASHDVTVNGVTYSRDQLNSQHIPSGRIYEISGPPNRKYTTREGYKGEFVILKFTDVYQQPDISPNTRRDRVEEAKSISEVVTQNTEIEHHLWYYDATNKEFWLRLVTGEKANKFGVANYQDGVKQPFSMHYGVRIR